jgi:hypothetical protein
MANLSPFRGPQQRAQFITKYESIMRSWPVPCEERDVETAFGQTHIAVSGAPSAPPLILLHGASATLTMWSPIITELADTYRCYCIDTITDANKSVAVQPIGDAADYVDWLQQIFSALGITQASRGSAAGSPPLRAFGPRTECDRDRRKPSARSLSR